MSEELFQLRDDFNNHIKRFDAYRTEQDGRIDRLCAILQQNTVAIDNLTESTEGVISLYNDVNGSIRLGKGVQNFCIWLAKWGVVGGVLAGGISWIAKHWGA